MELSLALNLPSVATRGEGVRKIDLNGYYFAASRLRENQAATAIPAGSEYRVDSIEFFSPPYTTNDYRIPLPGYYTTTSPTYDYATDTNPSERDAPNNYNVEGVYLSAFISGAWVSKLVPNSALTIQPGVGVLLDPVNFTGGVPANTRMLMRIASNVSAGGAMIAGLIPSSATGRLEGARYGAASQLSQAAGVAALMGTDGRLSGGIFCPPWIVAKAVNGLDRPVVLIHGDSKYYGKNNLEVYNQQPYLGMGAAARALDYDQAGSRRIVYANIAIPSVGVEQRYRANWSRKLDLIKLVSNRPYTHIVTNSYNNGWMTANWQQDMGLYYDILKAESRAWGNNAAALYQERPIARANSSDWVTSLAGQNPGGAGESLADYKWAGFDAALIANSFPQLAGTINANRDWAYDQGSNRNKIALSPKQFTLAADYTSGATTVSLVEQPSVGDNLILSPSSSTGGAYVRLVSGSGPYTATIYQGVTVSGLVAGNVVKTSYAHDRIGLHPSDLGTDLLRPVYLEWKAANLAEVPA